jgi:hypothetical protein
MWEALAAGLPQRERALRSVPAHDERFFRWQYLHVIGRQTTANAVLHDTDIFGRGDSAYSSLCHDGGGTARHARRPHAALVFGASSAHTDSSQGVRRSGNDHFIDVRVGGLRLAGVSSSGLGFTAPTIPTVLLERNGRRSHWEVLHFGAAFAGCLVDGAARTPLSGNFYMDRQWGDLPLQEVVRDWVWGHLVGPDFELVFFDILTDDGGSVARVLVRTRAEVDAAASLECSYLGELAELEHPARSSRAFSLCVRSKIGVVRANLSLNPGRLLRLREHESHPGFRASYARWRIDDTSTACRGVTEHLRIRG